MTSGNTLLGDEELNMCVLLRMNREFMRFMRKEFPDVGFKTEVKLLEKHNEDTEEELD